MDDLAGGIEHEGGRHAFRPESLRQALAFAIYQKAGLAGRAELSAFFLEEMLLPMSPTATGQRGG